MSEWLGCGSCDEDCIESDAKGRFYDGQEAKCPDCGALNRVSADEDDCWVRWTCRHGYDDETPCTQCDAEEGDPK